MQAAINCESPTRTFSPPVPGSWDRDDEQLLVARAKNGCDDSVARLVERYESRVFRLAQNITSNHEDAEDVVQNAFAKAFQNLATFRGDSRFYTWLVRIVINEAFMKVRGRRYREISIDDAGEEEHSRHPLELEDWGPNPEERYSQEELREILAEGISELEPGHRIVFQLRDVEGFTTEETARALHLSLPAVKTRLRRARMQLRDSLDPYFREVKGKSDNGRAAEKHFEFVV